MSEFEGGSVMARKIRPGLVAVVFQDVDGWYFCSDDLGHLSTQGARFDTKRQAIAKLQELSRNSQIWCTHYRCGSQKVRRLK